MNKVALSIGTFDGMHLGHQQVIKRLVSEAGKRNLLSVVITFNNIPKDVIKGTTTPKIISIQAKEKMLMALGVDQVYSIDFTPTIQKMSQSEFLSYINIDPEILVIGDDFRFGNSKLSSDSSIHTIRIQPVDTHLGRVSSTKIRKKLQKGQIIEANQLLGYIYHISHEVVHGDKIGRTIGYPTVNCILEEPCALLEGVYSSYLIVENKKYQSISYVGKKPTFGENQLLLETHIFDLNRSLYGKQVTIFLLSFIREDRKFDSAEQLQRQIDEDVQNSRIEGEIYEEKLRTIEENF